MEKVNNKNGIEFYYEIDKELDRVIIYDSSENYFNDYYLIDLEEVEYKNKLKTIIEILETTDLNNLCEFFGHRIYDTWQELVKEQDLEDEFSEDNILDNEYVNRFIVNDKVYYVWDWR